MPVQGLSTEGERERRRSIMEVVKHLHTASEALERASVAACVASQKLLAEAFTDRVGIEVCALLHHEFQGTADKVHQEFRQAQTDLFNMRVALYEFVLKLEEAEKLDHAEGEGA